MREDLVWCAGLFEGEGCLTKRTAVVHKGWSSWALTIRMTDEDAVDKFADTLRSYGIKANRHGPYMNGTKAIKPIHVVAVATKDHVYAACAMLYPFLCARRKQKFEEFFEWYKTNTQGRN